MNSDSKEYPTNYPADAIAVLDSMSVTKGKGVELVGSMSLRSQQYAGDYDANDFVPLEKELAYIEKYIGLQRLRFGHPVQAYLQVNGAISGIKIAPLLLVPFIENAFKHGDLAQGGRGIEAVLNAVDTKLYFYCFNTKGAGQKDIGGGIGLTNIRRRLHLLYPGRHTLQINDTPHSFTVNLELQYGQ